MTSVKAQLSGAWTNQSGSTLSSNNFDQNIGAICGTYYEQCKQLLRSGCASSGNLLASSDQSRLAIRFTVNFAGCGPTTVWTLNSATGFQGLWLLSLAEPVVLEWYQRRL
ncbi:Avidin family protein [Bradyrhizobium shewense]|uniref:Avidin family protein n=1 Tax=Bradyrhizobium shewense TaxID=1761772 RepID=A0A1C3XTE3_9BRAD|nr:Avidin family protein [Bradyrhizobium shewense]